MDFLQLVNLSLPKGGRLPPDIVREIVRYEQKTDFKNLENHILVFNLESYFKIENGLIIPDYDSSILEVMGNVIKSEITSEGVIIYELSTIAPTFQIMTYNNFRKCQHFGYIGNFENVEYNAYGNYSYEYKSDKINKVEDFEGEFINAYYKPGEVLIESAEPLTFAQIEEIASA